MNRKAYRAAEMRHLHFVTHQIATFQKNAGSQCTHVAASYSAKSALPIIDFDPVGRLKMMYCPGMLTANS